eukprot:gene15363-biopygen7083
MYCFVDAMMQYPDLVILASVKGLRVADLRDAASAKEALRRHRDRSSPPPPIPDDDVLGAMDYDYDDLVGLADRCGISQGCLDDEESARAALRARRGAAAGRRDGRGDWAEMGPRGISLSPVLRKLKLVHLERALKEKGVDSVAKVCSVGMGVLLRECALSKVDARDIYDECCSILEGSPRSDGGSPRRDRPRMVEGSTRRLMKDESLSPVLRKLNLVHLERALT